jgi:membrane fusion protein (multidrug efflux system)
MTESGDRSRARILVVETDAENVAWLRGALGERFEIEHLTGGAAALAALAADADRLLIVGAKLEDMSGAELLAKVGGSPEVTSLLVVDGDEHPGAATEEAVFFVLNRRLATGDVRAIVDRAAARPTASGDELAGRAAAERMKRLLEVAHRLAMQTRPEGAAAAAISAVRDFCDADRAHCLYFDADSGTLWSAGEGEHEELEHRASAGLAGFAARTGMSARAERASSDPRYRQEVDDPVGDGDERLLVQPVIDPDGTIHAVLVAVRQGKRLPFGDEEALNLAGLAKQWGPLLQRLALQVEAESVLQEEREREDAEALFRREAVDAYVSHLGHGDVVRVSPAWVAWTYRALVLILVACAAYLWLGTVDEYSRGRAVIQTSGRTEVTAPVAGSIVTIEVTPGQRVSADEVLARYHSSIQEAEFDRVERRWQSLLRDYLVDPANESTRRAMIAVRAERDRAVARLEELTVRAPHAGIVSEIRVRPNQHVVPGNPIMSLTDDETQLYVTALLPGGDLPQLHPGMRLRLELTGYRYAYQDLVVESVSDEVIGPAEVRRYFGERLGDTVRVRGPVVLVRARLPSRTFVADNIEYEYHDGMQGMAEVRVRSQRVLMAIVPGLKGL